jgi:hypothetical protein
MSTRNGTTSPGREPTVRAPVERIAEAWDRDPDAWDEEPEEYDYLLDENDDLP